MLDSLQVRGQATLRRFQQARRTEGDVQEVEGIGLRCAGPRRLLAIVRISLFIGR